MKIPVIFISVLALSFSQEKSKPNSSIVIENPVIESERTATNSEANMLDAIMDRNEFSISFNIKSIEDKNTAMKLLHAQKITTQLFEAIEKNNLIVAGKSEEQINNEVNKLALEQFGIEKHWHKRIVRSGLNTMSIYKDNPPNQTLQNDDIIFIDFGSIVDGWESDFARTYVIGNNEAKLKLKKDVEKAWYETQAWYLKQNTIKASVLFKYVTEKAQQYGYTFGGEIAGHIVDKFPHEQPADPKSFELDVHPDNYNDMLLLDSNGNKRHWILEIHFIDKKNQIGGYMEQLL